MLHYIALPFVGFLIGFLVVSMGGGGGGFYVGILTAFFNISPAIAASTSLATMIPSTAMGAFSHYKAGNVNLRLGLTMFAGGAAGSVIGSLCSELLPQGFYNKITGVILLLLGISMLVPTLKKGKSRPLENRRKSRQKVADIVKAVAFGLLVGILSGLVGISGGGPIVAGLAILGCGALETAGTSVLVLLGVSTTGFVSHLGLGHVDWQLVGLLVIGTVSGAFIGPVVLKKVDKKKLEKVLMPAMVLVNFVLGGLLLFK